MDSVPHTPTIVVGLGNAGCKMATTVNERVKKEGASEYIEVLGIDTRRGDINNTLPTDASSLVLEEVYDTWEEERQRAPYLSSDHELSQLGGAQRQRPVGRHFLDNPKELDRAWQFLESNIEGFVAKRNKSVSASQVTELNIWVVNSLAGGTGSGVFPLVAGLLDEVLAELEAEQRIETTLRGVGSLLRIERLTEQMVKHPTLPSYYLNAYTALKDLQVLLDNKSASISLHPDASSYIKDELEVGGAFDQYLLVGVREQEQDYFTSVNRMVADAIYYFGATVAMGNLPNHPQAQQASLFSLDAGELTLPVETADEYVALGEEIEETQQELDRLEHEREETADDLHYLNRLLSIDRDTLPPSESPIPRTLVRRCEDEATAIIRQASPEELDKCVNDAITSLEDDLEFSDNRDFDSSTVVRHLLLSRLVPTVGQERTQTQAELSDLVTTLIDTYQNSLQHRLDEDVINTLESNPAMAAEEIIKMLKQRRGQLVEKREESLPLIGDIFGDLEARIQEVEQSLEALSMRRSEYEQYKTLDESVRRAFSESRDTLSTLRMEVEEARYELDNQLDENIREVERIQIHRERLATELGEHTRSRHRTSIPIEQLEWLNTDTLERARKEGFTALVESGLIERETIEQVLGNVCLNRQEPIQDRQMFQPSFSVLAPILAETNTEGWLDDIELAAMGGNFDMMEQHADTTDTLSVSLLGLYAGIDLDSTSEFGTIDEYFTDPDQELSELFGSEVETIPSPIAYPELY